METSAAGEPRAVPAREAIEEAPRTQNLAVAQSLASVGIPVFPARVSYNQRQERWEKTPCIKGWRSKATADAGQIARWWRQYPNAVAGIELGRAKLFVIDPDRHGGPDGVAAFDRLVSEYGSLPAHPRSQTPGGGSHHIFAQPDNQPLGNRTGALPAGVDVRGAGGWIVAPGSVRADGRRWEPTENAPSLADAYKSGSIPPLPLWLAAIIRATPAHLAAPLQTKPLNGAHHSNLSSSREAVYARQALRGAARDLSRAPIGSRNNVLNGAAFHMGRMIARGWIDKTDVADELSQAAIAAGLDVDETQATLASALPAGMEKPADDLADRPRATQRADTPQPSARKTGWPDPAPLPDGLLPVEPFDHGLLPEKVRPWVEDVSERMQCPPDYAGVTVMVALGSLIGRKVAVRPKAEDDWSVVPNEWGLGIGPPGVMKSPSQSEGLRPLKALGAAARETFNLERAEYELKLAGAKAKGKHAEKEAAKRLAKGESLGDLLKLEKIDEPTLRRYITTNATYEALAVIIQQNPNGVLVDRDEMLSLLDRLDEEGHADERGFYLTGWNGDSPYTVDRIGRGLDLHIDAVCISMIGGTQPARISQYLAQVRRGGRGNDGLIQRFGLMVWPDISPTWVNVDRKPKREARDAAFRAFQALDTLDWRVIGAERDFGSTGDEEGLPYLRLTCEAQELFVAWRTGLEGRLRQGVLEPLLESHLAKYRKLVPALALITHLADGAMGEVSAEAVDKALRWADYLETHAARTYGSMTLAAADAARAILGKIKSGHLNNEQFGSREIVRAQWSMLRDRETIHAALQLLVDHDWLGVTKVETAGRTATVYTVNPKVFAQMREEGT